MLESSCPMGNDVAQGFLIAHPSELDVLKGWMSIHSQGIPDVHVNGELRSAKQHNTGNQTPHNNNYY